MHDDLQAFRIQQLDKCIQDFQIPCRWIPDMGYQYGYPQFNFYPPSVYYLGELFHLAGFQFIDAAKIVFALGFILSALGMYLFIGSWLGKWPGFVAAILYTYVPYKAVNVYVRGALSEFWALVFYPFIFWASYQLIKTGKTKYIIFLALAVGGLFTTHNLMPVIFFPLAAVWVLIQLLVQKKWKVLPKLIAAGALGLGLASFFILPVAMEREYVHLETIVGGYFDYRQHYVSLEQLFWSNFWGYGSSVWGDWDGMNMSTGQIHFILAFVTFFLAFATFKKQKEVSFVAMVFFGLEMAVLFMIHQKSSPVWAQIKFLEYLQFPWRFLSDSVFLLAMLGGIGIYLIQMQKVVLFKTLEASKFLGAVIIAALFYMYISFFVPHTWLDITDTDKFTGKSWNKQLTISIFDYLPIYAKLPPIQPAPDKPEVMDGSAEFANWDKGSNWQQGKVSVKTMSNFRLPLFDFPGMEVKANGQKVTHWHDDCRGQEFCLGLISFNLPPGEYTLSVRLTDTPVRTAGNLITLTTVLILGFLAWQLRKRGKKA